MLRSRLMSVSEGKPLNGVESISLTDKQTDKLPPDNLARRTSVSSSQMANGCKNGAGNRKLSIAASSQGGEYNPQPKLSISSTKGPSLVGLFASKRLAKQLSSRVMRKRYGSFCDSSRGSIAPRREPTYKMEPNHKFDPSKVEQRIRSVMEDRLKDFPYNPKFCANMTKILSDEIKGEVKMLNFDRYKIVCTVMIGQRRDQGTQVCSRCAWNEALDNFASYTFMNDNIFSTATVYGIYTD